MQKAYNITGEIMELEELTVINCHEYPVQWYGSFI